MENSEYLWYEPTTSWKTQEEINQYELELIQQQQELERQQQEELERQELELIQQQEELERQRQQEVYEYQLPRVYALVGEDGVIQNTILASREFMNTKPYGDTICIENTDEVKNEPGIGRTYDETLQAFIEPKPYPSWILNEETCIWEAPVPKPTT
jgi:hypothetical protein